MKCALTLRVRAYSGATNRAAHRTTARMVAVVVDVQAIIAARVRKHWDGRDLTGAHGRQSFGVERGDEERKNQTKKSLEIEPSEKRNRRETRWRTAAGTIVLLQYYSYRAM